MSTGKVVENISRNNVAVIVIIGVIVYFILKGQAKDGLQALGLMDSDAEAKEEKKQEKEDVKSRQVFDQSQIWNTAFYADKKRPAGTKLVSASEAKRMATILYNSLQGAGTNEDAIFGVFRSLPSVAAGSWVAATFLLNFKKDLKSMIEDDFSKSELAKLGAIIAKLPLYK